MPKKRFEWRHLDQFRWRDGDWGVVQAHDAWLAAKAGADQYDSEDRLMVRSGAVHLFEVRDEDGKITRWIVHGEACPMYYASPAPDPVADA
jgi:hypothetical protein